ncbi:MAG: TPM domain-containing protein, partial [Hydrogenophaga sp.]|nr:TPM domain-containing protein [Hydrogenophaga sp.]
MKGFAQDLAGWMQWIAPGPTRRPVHWLLPALFAALLSLGAHAQGLQAVPELRARVMDQTGTLDAASLAALERKLAAFEAERGAQVMVLMVPTTAPEDIADYTQRL